MCDVEIGNDPERNSVGSIGEPGYGTPTRHHHHIREFENKQGEGDDNIHKETSSVASSSSAGASKNNLLSIILGGFGLTDESSIPQLPEVPATVEDSVVMAADLLISNPYKTTSDKYDELKQMTNIATGSMEDMPLDVSTRPDPIIPSQYYPSPSVQSLESIRGEPITIDTSERDSVTTLQYHLAPNTALNRFNRHRFKLQFFSVEDENSATHDIELGDMYLQLKDECAKYEKNPSKGRMEFERPPRDPLQKSRRTDISTRRGVPRLFGSGYIDGIRDFMHLDLRLNFDDGITGASSSTNSIDNLTVLNKSALFFRRYSIWMAFYTAAYPVRAVIGPDRVRVFVPTTDVGVVVDEKFSKEILQPIQMLLAGINHFC